MTNREVRVRVGGFQMVLVLLLSINYAIVAMNDALPVFHNHTPVFRCEPAKGEINERNGGDGGGGGNSSGSGSSCGGKFAFASSSGERSVATEWVLVRERQYLAFLGPTVYHVGLLIGSLIGGFSSDRIGRFPVQAVSLYAQAILAVSLYAVQDYPAFLVVRGIQGLFVQGLHNSTYALSLEVLSVKARTLVVLLMHGARVSGLFLLATLSYVVPDWRTLQLAISVPSALTVLYVWIIPESPSWLLAKGKYTEADMVLERIAKYNGCRAATTHLNASEGRDIEENCSGGRETGDLLKNSRKDEPPRPSTSNTWNTLKTEETFLRNAEEIADEILEEETRLPEAGEAAMPGKGRQREESLVFGPAEGPVLWKYGALMACQRFASATAACFVESLTPSFPVNRHVNFALAAALEVVAYILAYFLLNKYRRRHLLCVYQLLSGTFCVLGAVRLHALPLNPVEDGRLLELPQTVILAVGKVVALGATYVVYLYTAEVFPTLVRGTFLGLCVSFAEIGRLCTPPLLLASTGLSIFLPITVVSATCLASGLAVLFLPETLRNHHTQHVRGWKERQVEKFRR